MEGHHQRHGEKLVMERPRKMQKLINDIIICGTALLLHPTKLCQWLLYKVMPSSSLPTPASSSELIPFNNNNDVAGPDHTLLPNKYDIFISFRGVDVRSSFLSHLYFYLNDYKKFAVYKDDVNLERGQQISPSLLQAIERSDVYVVILSPHYADSSWCLEELEKILKCREQYGRRVIPVFYGVNPSDIESQKLPSTAGKIQSWRAALKEIANISGFDSQVLRPETKLIEEIGKAVFQAIHSDSQVVKFSSYSASRGLVGVERKINQVEAWLCLEDRGNMTIGLWGMAGIGKTILAKALFDLFSSQFEASYFFSNFADAVTSGSGQSLHGDLQNDLFSRLLGDESGQTSRVLSYNLTLHRLGRTRSLIVLDDVGNDVGNVGPLKDLLNGQQCDLFGSGSIIIMTSRNKQLLKSVCQHVYEVQSLDKREAFRLFCLHAFKNDIPQSGYWEMVQRAIDYVGGNPLAIAVLGSHLYGRDLKFWDCELDALPDNPNPVLDNVLRRSYDGLTQAEKDVFLDLACSYNYWQFKKTRNVEELLLRGGRGNIITNLIDKSLIHIDTIGNHSHIRMNAMLQDLGRNIVNEERQIGKRSRLWRAKDIYYFFKDNKGTESIEVILWLSSYQEYNKLDLDIQPDAFVNMENLRILVIGRDIRNLVLPENGLKCLPNELRILSWYRFASKGLPSQFSAENLVTLDLSHSKIEQLWEDELNMDLGNLKFLSLDRSIYLRKLSNLSTAKRLVEIHLKDCGSLVELPTSILDLPKLELLDVRGCHRLKWNNLECYADGSREQNLRRSSILPNLKTLFLGWTPIQKVPNFITGLHILELDCESCMGLAEFPVIPSLKKLSLTDTLIKEVVEVEKFTELQSLKLCNNKQLVHIPNDFSKLKFLGEVELAGCSQLKEFPDSIISVLIHAKTLDLSYTGVKELPSSIGDLTLLSRLLLTDCKNLANLPDTIHKLSKLETLGLDGCDQLSHLPEIPSSLIQLDAFGCKSLKTLSIDVEKRCFSHTEWSFGNCRKLDPKVCSKLVDKFTQDAIGSYRISHTYRYSYILLPAKLGHSCGGGERSIMGSNDNNNNTMAMPEFRGHPWKLKGLIFCALLSCPPHLDITNEYKVECVLLDKDHGQRQSSVRPYKYKQSLKNEDQECYPNDLLVWKDEMLGGISLSQIVAKKIADDHGSAIKFVFRIQRSCSTSNYGIPNFIKTCRVIPVYDDRVVAHEGEEEEVDGDYRYADNHHGLYDQMNHSDGRD